MTLIQYVCMAVALALLPAGAGATSIIGIRTDHTQMELEVASDGSLRMGYYGERLSGVAGAPDVERLSSAYPARGGKYLMIPALSVSYADGQKNTELRYVSHQQHRISGNVERTEILLQDPLTALEVQLVYDAYPSEDVILSHSRITNGARKAVVLGEFASSCLQLDAREYLLTSVHGSAIREMQVEHEPIGYTVHTIENRRGTQVTHWNNPSFLLSLDTKTFSERAGRVIGGALCWSGNYKITFQRDEFGRLTILSGIHPASSEVDLGKGQTFETPEMVWTFSSEGAGGVSRNLHRWARRHRLYGGGAVTPTLLNSWEGAYFNFDTPTLLRMMDDAADLGLEMFVLDDGWFGSDYPRDNDRQGLGDWEPNLKKIPEGIDYLAVYAHSKGLKFGIWIEPEMVSPSSNLAQKHPEWIVHSPGREIPQYRQQWVLDLSNPQVQDFVFDVFDRTMQLSPNIDYVKWDCNRVIWSFGSDWLGKNQNRFYINYVQGLYAVLRRIREKYPEVMIQSCSSGGARVDYGVLGYCNEIWASDNTDALARLSIQYGTNLFYPAAVTASHVSVVPNHQTGRVLPLKFRFDVASTGRLGMELQPAMLSSEERAFAATALENYKRFRHLVFNGDLYRFGAPGEGTHYALSYVSEDRSEAVVFIFCTGIPARGSLLTLQLDGLDPSRKYSVDELNVEKTRLVGGTHFDGDELMARGMWVALNKPLQSAVFYLKAE